MSPEEIQADRDFEQFTEILAEKQRCKNRDMQLAINRFNRSRDDDHSRDEELDALSEVENDNS